MPCHATHPGYPLSSAWMPHPPSPPPHPSLRREACPSARVFQHISDNLSRFAKVKARLAAGGNNWTRSTHAQRLRRHYGYATQVSMVRLGGKCATSDAFEFQNCLLPFGAEGRERAVTSYLPLLTQVVASADCARVGGNCRCHCSRRCYRFCHRAVSSLIHTNPT